MKRRALVLVGLLVGCGGKSPSAARDSAGDGGMLGGRTGLDGGVATAPTGQAALFLVDPCPGGPSPPDTLECTGLYTNIATKQLAGAARAYAPAVPLWSDGAEKTRWVYLPPGQAIDTSTPNEWVFPIGTKFWKEFSREGKRIETRLFEKIQRNFWRYATYAWNADETATQRSSGGDLKLPSGLVYHIPTSSECDDCHKGRSDRVLGFEQTLLGLTGAQGVTLEQLVAEGHLTQAPSLVHLQVGDDGTGVAAPALAWLHVNCGVTCHNTNANSFAYPAGMDLRLDPTHLDGTSLAGSSSVMTTVGVSAKATSWNGAIRIVPGDSANSLLVSLISHRGKGIQMPPIATLIVDDADVANVVAWIDRMPPQPGLVPDAGTEAGAEEAGVPDAAAPVEASVDDGGAGPPVDDASVDAILLDDTLSPDVASIGDGGLDATLDASLDDGSSVGADAGDGSSGDDGSDGYAGDAGADDSPGEAASGDDSAAPDALE